MFRTGVQQKALSPMTQAKSRANTKAHPHWCWEFSYLLENVNLLLLCIEYSQGLLMLQL